MGIQTRMFAVVRQFLFRCLSTNHTHQEVQEFNRLMVDAEQEASDFFDDFDHYTHDMGQLRQETEQVNQALAESRQEMRQTAQETNELTEANREQKRTLEVVRQEWEQANRTTIEARLMLGHEWSQAIAHVRRESVRTGVIPIINAMATAGVVSLPGMMTGQILAGAPPMEAVKYQVLIMFLVSSGSGFGAVGAVWLGSRRLFDKRQRLRLDRLQ